MLSRYLHAIELGNEVVVLHALHPQPLFVEKNRWEHYLNGCSDVELEAELRDELLVMENKEEDTEVLQLAQKEAMALQDVVILYLVLTRSCNLSCTYCFEDEQHTPQQLRGMSLPVLGANPYNHRPMSLPTAFRALDLYQRHIKRNRSQEWNYLIILYGGEPLSQPELIRAILPEIRRRRKSGLLPANTSVTINTNGTLLTEELAQFLGQEQPTICLSIDGPLEDHDRYRTTKGGRGSYKQVARARELLAKYNVPLSLSITVTPQTVDRMPELLEWAYEMHGVGSLSFNPLLGASLRRYLGSMSEEEYGKRFAANLVRAYERSVLKHGLYEDRIMRKVVSLTEGRIHLADCGAYGQQLVVQPDGSIGLCHATPDSTVAHVSNPDFDLRQHALPARWRRRLPLFREDCQDCEAIGICGGGCAHAAEEKTGSIAGKDVEFCEQTQQALRGLIRQLHQYS